MFNEIIIKDRENLDRDLAALAKRLAAFWPFDIKPISISWGEVVEERSLNQNALYWKWMGQLAEAFSKGQKFTKEEMSDLMKHKFLGYETKTIGNTVIENQLISTASLDKGEMSHYMDQIDHWATELGVRLIWPGDPENRKQRNQV